MCDTLGFLLPELRCFAKNSDRSPNEPQIAEWHPAAMHAEKTVRATYIDVQQVRETRGVLLSRPAWMWGAEMGVSDAGVCIGNEAVFTKGAYGSDALTGMDLVRLTLERASDAKEAVRILLELLDYYGQGGNCGFDHTFRYDNSFLIMDATRVYVLETAGKHWTFRKCEQASISNRLSIRSDGRRYSGEPLDFAQTHTDPLFTAFSGAADRQARTQEILCGGTTLPDVLQTLRSHARGVTEPFCRGTVRSCCMHAGGLVGDHTTASMVVELRPGASVVYLTGTSAPCVSLYEPALLGNTPCLPIVNAENADVGKAYWLRAERFRRTLIGRTLPDAFYHERDAIEAKLFANVSDDPAAMLALSQHALDEETAFYARWEHQLPEKRRVPARFARYWKKKDAALEQN